MINLIAQVDFNKINNKLINQFPGMKAQFQPMANSGIAGLINIILPYIFVIAGLMLLFFLIAGGFQMITSANNEAGLKSAHGKITSAIIGFFILFVSFWLVQILEKILGVTLL